MSSGSDTFGGQQVSTKEMEEVVINLMFEGKASVESMRESGYNYQVGSREYTSMYQRYYRKKTRPKKKDTGFSALFYTIKNVYYC